MVLSVSLFLAVCAALILSILLFPTLKIGKIALPSYPVVTVLGAILLVAVTRSDLSAIGAALVADTAVNPIKILVLFFSMTLISVFLDEVGFFRFLAAKALGLAHGKQIRLFLILYLVVSVLTVFTSNDIIILSFTPFICYFAKAARIDPVPYLAAEFVAANTWSMALVIGNPTNIYLSQAFGIDFMSYLSVMWLPTLAAGTVAFVCLFFLFRTSLAQQAYPAEVEGKIEDKLLLGIGAAHLGIATVALAISSYIDVPMWLVAAGCCVSLFLFALVISLVRRKAPREIGATVKRAPFALIPFVLSMFVMILVLGNTGVAEKIASLLSHLPTLLGYGASSFLAANLINNIPMSVLFASVIGAGEISIPAVYAAIVGSNLGALLTPIGALAGMMWKGLLAERGYKFGYRSFLILGFCVAVPALAATLLMLFLVL